MTGRATTELLTISPAPGMAYWKRVSKSHPVACWYADQHYTRQTHGSPQFMPPGQTIVLLTPVAIAGQGAVFGWWRPKPGIKPMNGYDGWTCTIFHREGKGPLASAMIRDAENAISLYGYDCGPDGLLTYVGKTIGEEITGYCFRRAGYKRIGESADGTKWLLRKHYHPDRYPLPFQGTLDVA